MSGVLLTVIAVLVLELFILEDTTPITGVGAEPIPRNWIYERHTEAAGYEGDPALSPGGRMLAFMAKGDDGTSDIMLQRVGGRTPMNLTGGNGANDFSPAFSPDGEQIAFVSEEDGGGIFIMGATGESIRRVTDFGMRPSFSPDGRKLTFSSRVISPARYHETRSPRSTSSTSRPETIGSCTKVTRSNPPGHPTASTSRTGRWANCLTSPGNATSA